MSMINAVLRLLSDYTFQVVALGALSFGVLAGAAGSFAVLRKQSLLGDSIAHSSLAGIALSFILFQSKETEVLLLGALVIGMISAFISEFFSKHTRVNFESSIALVMSTFFGIGLILLTQIQKYPNSNQAGLDRFLFGQAATILKRDVYLTLIVCVIVLILMVLHWKELTVYAFDPVFAQSINLPVKWLNFLLSGFTVAAVIMGIQMVGVVLMSALLIAPAVAARQWTNSLKMMVVLAALIGGVSGISGTVVSSLVSKFPAGPAIVLFATGFVLFSLFFAPRRGLLSRRYKQHQAKIAFEADMLLVHLFGHHDYGLDESFSEEELFEAIQDDQQKTRARFEKLMKNLRHRSQIESAQDQRYQLTKQARYQLFDQKEGGEDHVKFAN